MRRGACNENVATQPHPAQEFASKLFVNKHFFITEFTQFVNKSLLDYNKNIKHEGSLSHE